MKPVVIFKLNKSLDKRMALEFLSAHQGGVDDAFYDKHSAYLKGRARKFQEEWGAVEEKFLSEVSKTFKGYPFPKGKYIGYLSIIDCNPRFLEDKTFQIFYQHPDGVQYVTAHELLHFIFYDYATKKHSQLFKELNPEEGIFWDAAEIFNSVILNTPSFVEIHGLKERRTYPEHRDRIFRLTKTWQRSHDVDQLIVATNDLLTES